MKRVVFPFVFLALPLAVFADPCEELEVVNEGWTSVMSKVSEYESGAPLDEEQRRDLTLAIVAQFDGSEALPWSFDDAGDERGYELGTALVDGVKSLFRPIGELYDNDEALAESLDDIEEALEALGDYCAAK